MKCLVTGGAGFIGSNLVDRLILENNEVIVIDNEQSDAPDQFYWNDKAINYKYDICDFEKCNEVFEKHEPEIVFHLAAEARIPRCIKNPIKAVQTNTLGTSILLELSRKYKVKRFIYSSTSSAYGLKNNIPQVENMETDCLNPYSVTKVAGEELCKMYSNLFKLETIIFRYFNVYGERQPLTGQYAPVIGIFLNQKNKNIPMTIVGDGNQRRDFTHVSDVVEANILAANFIPEKYIQENETKFIKWSWGQIFNVGTGKNYSVNDVANFIGGKTQYIPAREGECRFTLADNTKIKKYLKWSPKVSLEEWISKHK